MGQRRDIKEAYDEMAEEYFDQYTTEVREQSLPEPVERFCTALDPDDRLLSAGCGPGDHPLVAADEQGVGLDISREQLELARTDVPGALVQSDITSLPFSSNSFDAVAALYSLIHVPLQDHSTVIEEFERVLRPGGTVLLTEGGVEWRGSNPDWLDSGTEMRWSMAGPEATRADLETVGFRIQGVWDVRDPTTEEGTKPFFLAELGAEQ